jgi:hypothetical protein
VTFNSSVVDSCFRVACVGHGPEMGPTFYSYAMNPRTGP